ncbi:MAG: Polyol:NADP oxidoreductase [Candidatus Erwinia impunctatus]|nr:Polyol:NADP oxidoreductase [Culicoides impunctatus]
MTAIDKVILWDSGIKTLVNEGALPDTKIISFTVTESGYFLDDDGELDLADKAIRADLKGEEETRTLYGALTKILRARMQQQSSPVTLLNCDNLRHNGDAIRHGLNTFISALNEPELQNWVNHNISTPNGMVDRITPKFDEEIFARLKEQNITDDNALLTCEHFAQWVIEDDFIAGRPPLEEAGVEFVSDVLPYEEAKIRVLNASHSGVAWAGGVMGKKYIDQSLSPQVASWITAYVTEELQAALGDTAINLEEYSATTLERFGNKWVRDTVQRVSSDSIAKLHEFIVPTLKTRYQQGAVPSAALILVALYFCFMRQRHQGKLACDYLDSTLDDVDFAAIFTADDPVAAFAGTRKLFGSLSRRAELAEDLRRAIEIVENNLINRGD